MFKKNSALGFNYQLIEKAEMGEKLNIQIFADNYRGFKKIDLDLSKNIFLVGDNSSGKSSIIHLINSIFTDELDKIQLDDRYAVGKYDFFSPYFNHEDVTIGFIREDEDSIICKAITIRKGLDISPPKIIRFTLIKDDKLLSVKRGTSLSFKYKKIKKIKNAQDLREMHYSDLGFVNSKEKISAPINNPLVAIKLSKNHKSKKEIHSLAFSTMGHLLPAHSHTGPIRALPENFYPRDRKHKSSGAHFASMWHDLIKEKSNESINIVKKFGKDSKLFDTIKVERISKSIDNSPLLVTLTRQGHKFLINQVGTGVSQVIPMIIESIFLRSHEEDALVLLQQPELHLHPIAQAAIGEFIYNMSQKKIRYVVETHSDYLMDRFRAKIKESGGLSGAQIAFCENSKKGNTVKIIDINPDGSLKNPPKNYKEFFINELMRTMF